MAAVQEASLGKAGHPSGDETAVPTPVVMRRRPGAEEPMLLDPGGADPSKIAFKDGVVR